MDNQKEIADNEKEETELYIYEKTVAVEESNLKSIGKSIENERTKASVLIGFYFLVLIALYPLYIDISQFLKGIILILIIVITYLLINSFCSEKINEGVVVDKNFDYNWSGKKDFLKKYYEILNSNKKQQKLLLSRLSKNISHAIVLLSLVVLMIFSFNLYKYMTNNEDRILIQHNRQESQESVEKTNNSSSTSSQENSNPMKPDTVEKTK